MPRLPLARTITVACIASYLAVPILAEDRLERFDRDPGWDGNNHRSASPEPRTIRQDFGYSRTARAGGNVGEIGGFLSPAAEPAYYAKIIPAANFNSPLSASGTLAATGRPFHALIGFFNAGTLNEWRTPNTIAIRISGRGDVFYAWLEYATSRWRAGGDEPKSFPMSRNPHTGRNELVGFPADGRLHHWSIRYEPEANGGRGTITATIDDQTSVCNVADGHRADGAEFNRFGILNVMKSGDEGGEFWLDDVTINGVKDDFSNDPGWDELQNRRTYTTTNVRPRFDFGFSPTHFAGGQAKGELGGLVFRGDCRYPARMAYYGDRLGELTLDKPLRAAGRVSLRRGVTDSTVLIGFFHARDSMRVNPSQDQGLPANFLGVSVDGPSREGFFFAPVYRDRDKNAGHCDSSDGAPPYLYPDGTSHTWTLNYDPAGAGGRGQITLTLDEQTVRLDLAPGVRAAGTRFDRFGIVTTWIDGNGQQIYFDDLRYTCRQE